MQEYIEIIKNSKLFEAIDENNIGSTLSCLGAKKVSVKKGDFLLISGNPVTSVGIVLEGAISIEKITENGDRIIIASLSKSDMFGEALCCAGVKESPVSVVAEQKSKILLIEFSKIISQCSNHCANHAVLVLNMLKIIARKNLFLQNRIDIISKRTVRERLLTYLEHCKKENQKIVSIPLNREELADYLCVHRSALSHELSKMKQEGLIDYHKNSFKFM